MGWANFIDSLMLHIVRQNDNASYIQTAQNMPGIHSPHTLRRSNTMPSTGCPSDSAVQSVTRQRSPAGHWNSPLSMSGVACRSTTSTAEGSLPGQGCLFLDCPLPPPPTHGNSCWGIKLGDTQNIRIFKTQIRNHLQSGGLVNAAGRNGKPFRKI